MYRNRWKKWYLSTTNMDSAKIITTDNHERRCSYLLASEIWLYTSGDKIAINCFYRTHVHLFPHLQSLDCYLYHAGYQLASSVESALFPTSFGWINVCACVLYVSIYDYLRHKRIYWPEVCSSVQGGIMVPPGPEAWKRHIFAILTLF